MIEKNKTVEVFNHGNEAVTLTLLESLKAIILDPGARALVPVPVAFPYYPMEKWWSARVPSGRDASLTVIMGDARGRGITDPAQYKGRIKKR